MGDASTPDVEVIRPVIYVTGFGPFTQHDVNASQLAVERLAQLNLEAELGVRLVTEIVKVEYDYVKKVIPQRWKELKPKLTVHVGVSGLAETLVLEQLARNSGYFRQDNCGCQPEKGICVPDGEEVVQSGIRMDLISSSLNKNTQIKLPCAKSTDPGLYLCEFIYYTSLKEDRMRSVFVHVPTVKKCPTPEVTLALAAAIKEMYWQVSERDQTELNNGESVKIGECGCKTSASEGLVKKVAAAI